MESNDVKNKTTAETAATARNTHETKRKKKCMNEDDSDGTKKKVNRSHFFVSCYCTHVGSKAVQRVFF